MKKPNTFSPSASISAITWYSGMKKEDNEIKTSHPFSPSASISAITWYSGMKKEDNEFIRSHTGL